MWSGYSVTHGFGMDTPVEIDVGTALNFKDWGIGLLVNLYGADSPNCVTLFLGPFSFWITVWYWKNWRIRQATVTVDMKPTEET